MKRIHIPKGYQTPVPPQPQELPHAGGPPAPRTARQELNGRSRHASPLPAAAAALAVAAISGCAVTAQPRTSDAVAPDVTEPILAEQPIDLDAEYLIGPTNSRDLRYRIDWQTRTSPQANSGIKQVSIQHDSVLVLDGQNFLTRLRREDGTRLWRIPVAEQRSEIHGITFLPYLDRIFLSTGSDIFILDADTGSLIRKQRLGQIASTAPVVFGRFFLYGARNGQLVWHSFDVGFQWRAFQISSSIRIPPLIVDGYVVTVGTDGRIMILDASSATSLWERQLLNEVIAAPVAGENMVYIAGLDQYVWAFDLQTGRSAWRHLSESPLEDSPVLIGDRLYQQIPAQGLVCFEARPVDAPGGKVIWQAPDVRGNVVSRYPDHMVVWDGRQRLLTTVGTAGAVIKSVSLPWVKHLQASGLQDGNLVAAADDGRVIRLVPRD